MQSDNSMFHKKYRRLHDFWRSIILSLLIGLFSQCSIILKFYGISKPGNEPIELERKYIHKLGIDTTFMYRLSKSGKDSLSSKNYAINLYKLKTGTHASPVQIRMYNRTGELAFGWEQCFGSLDHFDIFKTVPMSSFATYLPINKELNLWNDLKLIDMDSAGRAELTRIIKNYQYTVIVYWAGYAGYFSKNTLKEVNKYISANEQSGILFLKVNTASF